MCLELWIWFMKLSVPKGAQSDPYGKSPSRKRVRVSNTGGPNRKWHTFAWWGLLWSNILKISALLPRSPYGKMIGLRAIHRVIAARLSLAGDTGTWAG